jgi:AcrR family transcriptional regulator
MAAMATVRTARDRARAEVTAEIKAAARRQLAEVGASALSLRAVARELGMVSSAVYRYFPSRDELLTVLIIDAYDAVGAAAEAAAADRRGGLRPRWLRLARAVRAWAVASPHEYALVYGSPVPGYRAPETTVPAAARVSLAALGIVADAVVAGEVAVDAGGEPLPKSIRHDLAALRDTAAPGVPDDVLLRTMGAWAQLFGAITFDLFGHLHGVISDMDAWFDHEMRAAAAMIAGGVNR